MQFLCWMSSATPTFSLAYTSVRPACIPEVVTLWDERSALKSHQWIISVDEGDAASLSVAKSAVSDSILSRLRHHDPPPGEVVVNKGSKDCTAGWNCAAAAAIGKIIIAVADDFRPPRNWDSLLLALEPKGWEDGEYVVKVADGYNPDIFTLAILTRKRYDRFGYLWYPRYRSLFNDTEFGTVAQRDGVVIDAQHLLFEHLHPDCGKRQRDVVDLVHASQERWKAGEMLYNFRKARNFPLDDGPKAVVEAPEPCKQANDRYAAYMQVVKDDLCLLDVCHRLAEEGVKDFCLCQPDMYWSGEPVEPQDMAQIEAVAAQLRQEGHVVHHQVFHVEHYKMPGDTRIAVETRVRNASLEWVQKLGYAHILVVDGDELWLKGTLSVIKDYVDQGHKAVSCHMMPVIGVPGYPVDFASDVAVVYVAAGVTFKACRSPYVRQTIIPRPLMYHFTGTRKGMEETVKKHRRSGHYDDPQYEFEKWISEKLPNIAPGMEHPHMFKPYSIWKVVREWRPGELEAMPPSVRPYLPQPK